MDIQVMKSKIHRATVTMSDLNYIGSIGIDENMMDEVNLIENEKVDIYNITNGERFSTYVIKAERDSGMISLNGAAARMVCPGDKVIIVSYASMDFEEAKTFKPRVVFPDDNNKI